MPAPTIDLTTHGGQDTGLDRVEAHFDLKPGRVTACRRASPKSACVRYVRLDLDR
jgi:hypothetical protein